MTPPAARSPIAATAPTRPRTRSLTFTKAGTYYFKVTVTDASGLSAIDMVPVTVNAALSSITVVPTTVSVATSQTIQFNATARDQFGSPMSSQPSFYTWSVSGGGTISSTGLFTAGSTPGGSVTVTAASGSVQGSASVTVTGAYIWTRAGTSNNWSDAANWNLHAVPGLGATVIFNGTSSKNAIVDAGFGGTVSGHADRQRLCGRGQPDSGI